MFGSDYPFLTPERWLADFYKAGFRDEVKPGIMLHNAAAVLGL
jgi:predicted TIM-barrel fold metal-dependent hydrolase